MSGRSALATPTNVYPRNGNVVTLSPVGDGSDRGEDRFDFTFTCQSDSMSFFSLEVYDATTNKLIRHLVHKTFRNGDPDDIYLYHRGDTVNTYMAREAFDDPAQTFYTGYHYYYKITTYSCVPDPTGQYPRVPNCVVPYASGKVLEVASGESVMEFDRLKIQNGIPNLKPPSYWGEESSLHYKLIGCTYLRIGHEERLVLSYNYDTGDVVVDEPFPSSVLSENLSDTHYYLYCNYVESSGSESEGSYDFYLREKIESTLSAYPTPLGIQCKTTYLQRNNVGLENYRFRVYNANGDNYINGAIAETTSEIEELISTKSIPIGTGIESSLVGKTIKIAKSASATFEDDIVTDGYSREIHGYDSVTGIAYLNSNLEILPTSGTRYSIIMDDNELIADSGDVFNYHMTYNFPIYTLGQKLEIETTMTTYEKQQMTMSNTLYVPMPSLDPIITDHTIHVDSNNQRVVFAFENRKDPVSMYRTMFRRQTGDSTWHRIGYLNHASRFTDYFAGNNRSYEYMVAEGITTSDDYTSYDPSKEYKPYRQSSVSGDKLDVDVSWDGWTITSIYPYDTKLKRHTEMEIKTSDQISPYTFMYAQKPYYVGETWHFISEIDSGNITNNIGRTVHVGTSRMPTVTGTNNDYQSGTFSTNLLSLECPSGEIRDDIQNVDDWIKFINDECLFILKSEKGDVWIVAISDNTSRTYDESTPWVLTNASYSWVEVAKPEEIQIIE